MASISITAPSRAEEGERVSVSVRVTSTLAYHASYKATIYAVPDRYPDYVIGSISQIIKSGESETRSASFTMPDCNTAVFVWVERWSFDHWVYDGSKSKVVRLEIPVEPTFHLSILVPSWAAGGYVQPGSGDYPANTTVILTANPLLGYQFTSWGGDASGTSPTYNLYMNSDKNVEAYFEPALVPELLEGTISKLELEYDQAREAIPVIDLPQNQRGKVHIWGRNDMSTNQKLGIHWVVKDPDGIVVEEYDDWESWPNTDPDKTHEFISPGRFDLDKVGTYTIYAALVMDFDDPIFVDTYTGALCTVVGLEYMGTIIKKELEYNGKKKPIPIY